jgi:hypothetical protein
MDRIGIECSFLNLELDHVIMGKSYDTELSVSMQNLIGLAAHEKMYDLLLKYDK